MQRMPFQLPKNLHLFCPNTHFNLLAGNIHIGAVHLWVLLFSLKPGANADGEDLISSSRKF
jgi:hypothetical protein